MKLISRLSSFNLAVALFFSFLLDVQYANAQFIPPPTAEQLAEIQQQTDSANTELHAYLNALGYQLLDKHGATIAAIGSRAEAEQRQQFAHQQIVDLVGGIPATHGRVNIRHFDTVNEDGFHIENLIYESAPHYWVTANVYVPNGTGPFPALVIVPGHGAGKSSQYSWAANFAANGYVVLSIDPMGQGERLQHYDAELGASKVEPSGEHEHANQSALLLDRHIARYWFADGIRGVDYLSSRPDVDAKHIGTFGCSGGGTAAAYLAAIDTRIQAAVIASFITSFKELLPGNGPQDAEQTLPGFIANGFDFADWVELAAPRPVAILAFKQDFFPYAGAEQTYTEAAQFYKQFNAGDQLNFISGEGGHCSLGPVTPQILEFLNHHLKQSNEPMPPFTNRVPTDADRLLVTPTGQLSTSTDNRTVEALLRDEAKTLVHPHQVLRNIDELNALKTRIRDDIRKLIKITPPTNSLSKTRVVSTQVQSDYQLQHLTIESEPGIEVEAMLGIPTSAGQHAVVILMESTPLARIAASSEFERLAKAGNLVVAFQPRGVLGESPIAQNQLALGPYMQNQLRALIVGKTLTGMRVDDSLHLLDVLLARADVNPKYVTLYASGALGMTALHVAALDTRIGHVLVENTLVSYSIALQAGLHKNLSEILIPGVLRHYDTVELLQSISPRRVTLINPASAMGQRIKNSEAMQELSVAFATDQAFGTTSRVRVIRRNVGDPLPIPWRTVSDKCIDVLSAQVCNACRLPINL